jgi:hypothetical protein
MIKVSLSAFFLIVLPSFVKCQEQLGVRLDNYSGMQSTFLNPSHSANLPLKWNLNLAGAGIFMDNSYLFLRNTNVLNVLGNPDKIKLITEYKNEAPPSDIIPIDFFSNYKRGFSDVELKINGPAFAFHKGQHSGGIFYNMRFQFETPRIPSELNYYDLEQTPYKLKINIPRADARMMLWDEFGANYAYNWETNVGRAQIGINLKFLRGFEGGYAGSWSPLTIARYPRDSFYIGIPDVSFGLTTGNLDNIKNGTYELQRQGQGVGFDLGFAWVISEDDNTYQWRLSAALIDIGKIKFSPLAERHYINKTTKTNFLLKDNFDGIETPIQLIRRLSTLTMGDSLKSLREKAMLISTPMALSLMADYQFFPNAFATFIFQQRILQQDAPLHRGNMIAVSARYEHRWFSATIPISLYNYKHLRAGFAARLGYLTIGTEHLASWLIKRKLTGTDLYFGLTFNPFDINLPGLHIQARGKRDIRCYKF